MTVEEAASLFSSQPETLRLVNMWPTGKTRFWCFPIIITMLILYSLLQRKKSLLPEYKQRGKTNAFLDSRFGEHDESLGDEDKAILRFQKERMVTTSVHLMSMPKQCAF